MSCLLLGALLASVASAITVYRVQVSPSLNIRSAPSTSSSIVGSLYDGQYIVGLSTSSGFARFYLGYSSLDYLIAVRSGGATCWTTDYLNFREGPGTGYPIITTLAPSTAITKYAQDFSDPVWFVTSQGYAHSAYLNCNSNPPTGGWDNEAFYQRYAAAYGTLNSSAKSGLFTLLNLFAADSTMNNVRIVAYMLATVKHECANTWLPIEEYGRGSGYSYGVNVSCADPVTGQTCNNVYYGRGYVQLTWCSNYQRMGSVLGIGLACNPSYALQTQYAYKIMTDGMMNGRFTGVGITQYITASSADYYNARRVINGVSSAQLIAGYATTLEQILRDTTPF